MEYIILLIVLIIVVVLNYKYYSYRYDMMTEEEKEFDRKVREMRDERFW